MLALVLLAALPATPSAAVAGLQVDGPLTFHAAPGQVLDLGPLGSYRGTVEIRRAGGGLTVVNQLDLEEYTLGIREVPGMWPMEALKAQAIAARTYALWEKQGGRHAPNGFDICPTDACQVFRGAQLPDGEPGARWAEAVRATAGQVLLHDGAPALTRYHASSGGRTLPNHVVYPGSPPRPYLMGIDDPDDAVSPMHRWTADFPRDVLEALLRAELGFAEPMTSVRVEGSTAVIELEGAEPRTIALSALRTSFNSRAPQMFGDRYPGPRSDGQRLPSTIPSPRFTVEAYEGGFRFNGRGWGHGVGMSQWGAKGRADRGQTAAQILGAYYGGLQPQPWTGDATIRVGALPQGSQARVSSSGPVTVGGTPEQIWSEATGEWLVRPGPGRTLVVDGPALPPPPTPEPTPVPEVWERAASRSTTRLAAAPAGPAARSSRTGLMALAALLAAGASIAAQGDIRPRKT